MKLQVVNEAIRRAGARSIADLGGVWAVDGDYTIRALEAHGLERAVIVDATITPALTQRQLEFPQLELIVGNFGNPAMPTRVGPVDVMLLFDVLLHQVRPDWDEVLAMYAPFVRCFGIVNAQWLGSDHTVRLLDLGADRYREVVPELPGVSTVLARLDQHHEGHGRLYRDIFEVWQWGIVDSDLVRAMNRLGFELVWSQDTGPVACLSQGQRRELPWFAHRGFVFYRE